MVQEVAEQVAQLLADLNSQFPLKEDKLLVLGVSTSEVAGHRIGTQGSAEVAEAIFEAVDKLRRSQHFHVAYQCCEHLNRSLVVERSTAIKFGYTEVTAIPVPEAGGAMAAYAFQHLTDPVLVESVLADAGIDIGATLIGMHLKPVAVPVRGSLERVGDAFVTMAKTRPKLIGGARAVYP